MIRLTILKVTAFQRRRKEKSAGPQDNVTLDNCATGMFVVILDHKVMARKSTMS